MSGPRLLSTDYSRCLLAGFLYFKCNLEDLHPTHWHRAWFGFSASRRFPLSLGITITVALTEVLYKLQKRLAIKWGILVVKSTVHFYDSLDLKADISGWFKIKTKAYFHLIEYVWAKIELLLLGMLFTKERSRAWQVMRCLVTKIFFSVVNVLD